MDNEINPTDLFQTDFGEIATTHSFTPGLIHFPLNCLLSINILVLDSCIFERHYFYYFFFICFFSLSFCFIGGFTINAKKKKENLFFGPWIKSNNRFRRKSTPSTFEHLCHFQSFFTFLFYFCLLWKKKRKKMGLLLDCPFKKKMWLELNYQTSDSTYLFEIVIVTMQIFLNIIYFLLNNCTNCMHKTTF